MRRITILLVLLLARSSIQDRTEDCRFRRNFQPPKVPILLVPGIGGSILYANYISSRDGNNYTTRIWATNEDKAEFLTRYDLDIFPERGNYGIDGVYELDPGFFSSAYSGYMRPLIRFLTDIGYVYGKNLFAFPYDWRLAPNDRSIQDKFKDLVQKISPVVIAHSMGGLIVEEYLRNNPNDEYIRKFIAVSVPFKGAGGNALRAWIRGYNLGNTYLTNVDLLKRIIRNSYSGYWLLPQPTLIPKPTINDISPEKYLKDNGYFYFERYQERTPLILSKKKIYYISSNSSYTPYSYYSGSDVFGTVAGDGTVPIASSFHAEIHKQPLENQVIIKMDNGDNHVKILSDIDFYYKILELTDNNCDWRGSFKGPRGDRIYCWGNHMCDRRLTDLYMYLDCVSLRYQGEWYNRIISDECSSYQEYQLQTTNPVSQEPSLIYATNCVYGKISINIINSCESNQTYNYILNKCEKAREIAVEVIKEIQVEVIKEVPVEVIKDHIINNCTYYIDNQTNNRNQTIITKEGETISNTSSFLIVSIVLASCLFISIIIIVVLSLKLKSASKNNYYVVSQL